VAPPGLQMLFGIAALAVATTTAVHVVTCALYSSGFAGTTAGVVGAATVVSWYGFPLARRLRD
jgi:hypothetical protein